MNHMQTPGGGSFPPPPIEIADPTIAKAKQALGQKLNMTAIYLGNMTQTEAGVQFLIDNPNNSGLLDAAWELADAFVNLIDAKQEALESSLPKVALGVEDLTRRPQ